MTAVVTIRPDDHRTADAQNSRVVGPVSAQPASRIAIPMVEPPAEHSSPPPTTTRPMPIPKVEAWLSAGAELLILADALGDLEQVRIATENRVRSLEQVKGMSGTAEQARLQGIVEALANLEHQVELDLRRALRRHPLGPWVKATVGVGEKQGARLIATIGDPYWHSRDDRPRTVSELWALCGLHVLHPGQRRRDTQKQTAEVDLSSNPGQESFDTHAAAAGVAARRIKGQKANWSSAAKMRAYLVAESCIKQAHSPYRAVYDQRRAHTADRLHGHPCPRCGPSGHPAQPGTPWSKGHAHADGLRIVSKAILKDLWIEARRIQVQP